MDRVIYCPSEAEIDEASVLSKNLNLPILLGENDFTKKILFNRNIVQKLSIPKNDKCNIFYPTIKKNFHQIIIVENDFNIIKNNIKLLINNEEVSSLYEEKYRAKFVFIANKYGRNIFKILINMKEAYSGEFEVF